MQMRYELNFDEDKVNDVLVVGGASYDLKGCCELLNEQQATINELKAQLREKEQDEQLYANEIVKLNKEAKEVLDFKSLGGDY